MTNDASEVVSVEVLWVGMVMLAVLLLLAGWGGGDLPLRKAFRTPGSPSSRRTGSTSTSTSAHGCCSTAAALEKRAEELEAAGDLDGAMEALLASHGEGSSRAVALAHELSQRHPAGAFGANRCPLSARSPQRQEGAGMENGASADPDQASSDGAVADADAAAAAAAVSVVAPAPAAALASLTSKVLADDDDDGAGEPEEQCARSPPPSGEERTRLLSGESASATAAGPGSQAAATTATGALEPGKGIDHGGREPTTTTLLPWERGWQGREGFKPPSSAIADTGSTASNNVAGTAAAFGAGLSPSSSSLTGTGGQSDALDGGDAEATKLARRNFTVQQLNAFDGGCSAPRMRGGEVRAGKQRPIYIALKGEVYDASVGRHLYGPVSGDRQAPHFCVEHVGVREHDTRKSSRRAPLERNCP